MKIFKNIKNLEVYKFGAISPVLYEPGIRQNQYFRKLSKQGIEIPPGSGHIYYLQVSTYKGWLKKYNEWGLEGLKEKTRSDKGCYRKLACEIIQGINQVMEKTEVVSVKDLDFRPVYQKPPSFTWRMDENQLEQFFLCSINRTVRLDATVRIDNIFYEVDMKYVGEKVDIRFPIDLPDRFYLFENDRLVRQLKPVDLVENANPPYVATTYSKLFTK
jgi:hypothetical protein